MGYIELLIVGGILLVALIVILGAFIIVRIVSRKPQPVAMIEPELEIKLASLSSESPDTGDCQLEFYSTPVRLAVLVVAPKGNSAQVPNSEQLRVLIERTVPGMGLVLDQHEPVYRVWPAQMSDEGFAHAFYHNIKLPGDEGRGTPWCGVVGHITIGIGSLLIGMICVADSANQLGQVIVQHEGQWRDVLKVHNSN